MNKVPRIIYVLFFAIPIGIAALTAIAVPFMAAEQVCRNTLTKSITNTDSCLVGFSECLDTAKRLSHELTTCQEQ